jgi:hypothetical protein
MSYIETHDDVNLYVKDGAAHGLFASHKERFIQDVLNFAKTIDYRATVTRRGTVARPRVMTSPLV